MRCHFPPRIQHLHTTLDPTPASYPRPPSRSCDNSRSPTVLTRSSTAYTKSSITYMSAGDDPGAAARYYANPAEQKVLIAGLQRYFALPERSQNRNRVAKEVSQYLRYFSPHWSHRAVRLWFNNNKHTYFETGVSTPPTDPPHQPPPPPAPPTRVSLPQMPPPPPPPTSILLPPIGLAGPKVHFGDKRAPFPSLTTVASPQFQSLAPISFWNPATTDVTLDQTYTQISGIVSEMKRTNDRDPRFASLVQQFDEETMRAVSRFGQLDPQKVDGVGRFCRAPFRKEPSQLDLPSLEPLPKSISSDILDFPLRSLSFGQQLYLGDIGRGYSDQSIWQSRPHTDTQLAAFESVTLTPSIAAMTAIQLGSGERTLSVSRYAESPTSWVAHPLPVRTTVESMAADSHFAYLLTADQVFLVPLTRDGRPESAAIPATPSGRVVAAFMEGAVAGFHSSPNLLYVTAALAVRPITTQYRGIASIAPIDDRLLCAVIGSGAPRLLAPDGREARAFVGHTAPVLRVARLSDQIFASTADDSTVRVWDLRERFPVLSVGTNGVPIVNVAGSSEYLIAALHNKALNVFDLRGAAGRAVLGVSTQDYEPASLHYNPHEDMLAMFGVVENGSVRDSFMFLDRERQRGQKIFRVYRGFVGVDPR